MKLKLRTPQDRCPLCRDPLTGLSDRCRGCSTRYHATCFEELGGCSTLGCSHRRSRPAPAPPQTTSHLPVAEPSVGASGCALWAVAEVFFWILSFLAFLS